MSIFSFLSSIKENDEGLSDHELRVVLEEHSKWLKSDGKEGQRADLRGADLQHANLWRANLEKAELRWADLQGANLFCANLQDADLGEIKTAAPGTGENRPEPTNLKDAVLRGADLEYADLRNVKGFSVNQLAGTKATGIKLPPAAGNLEKGLERLAETTKSARRIFHILLGLCFYVLLTVIIMQDSDILYNHALLTLPIIRLPFPGVLFFLLAPLSIFSLHIYFQLYLQRLWEELSLQPAVFPDGKRLDEKAHPWFINSIAYTYFKHLQEGSPDFLRIQSLFAKILAWGLPPFFIAVIWWRYLVKHDLLISSLHAFLLSLCLWGGRKFYAFNRRTFLGDKPFRFSWKEAWREKVLICNLTALLFLNILFFSLSNFGINQLRRADLRDMLLSQPPPGWTAKDTKAVKGARLRGCDLRGADGANTFLVKADLSLADLKGADLSGADLREAVMQKSNLRDANFSQADLSESNLYAVKGKGTDFEGADLSRAYLLEGVLTAANFFQARLHHSILFNAELSGVNMQEAELDGADLRQARLVKADLRFARLKGANLQEAVLDGADLRKADLEGANLRGANLRHAKLDGADLRGADLEGAALDGAQTQGTIGFSPAEIKPLPFDKNTAMELMFPPKPKPKAKKKAAAGH